MLYQPYSSFGCGRSLKWEVCAIQLIEENNENCGHLEIENIILNYIKDINTKNKNIYCKIECPLCDKNFLESSKKLTDIYLNFYKRTSYR